MEFEWVGGVGMVYSMICMHNIHTYIYVQLIVIIL